MCVFFFHVVSLLFYVHDLEKEKVDQIEEARIQRAAHAS